ncbi:MAG: SLC13/DASS family transporter [Deltaproteobacteria bacterium]|nr:SLC13/DASS family transporter [Deltaproteobacteria bacterium]
MLRLLEAWDGLREKAAWRIGGVAAGVLIATAIVIGPTPGGLSEAGKRAGAVALVMALWWLGGVLPATVVALLPLVAFPLLGVMSTAEVAPGYADPLLFLMLGGFVLGHAMEEVGLHRRLVALLLRPAWVRARPDRVVLALMIATALVSGFVSNTGTMVMMLPLAVALAARVSNSERVRSAFTLSLAYACSIGGVATLVGTAPNAVFAGLAAKAGHPVSFVQWMAVGVPFVVMALPVAWWVVNRFTLRLPGAPDAPIVAPAWPEWQRGERAVLGVIVTCFALWISRSDVDLGFTKIPGWGSLLPRKVDDGFVAMAAALVLFLVPGRSDEGAFLLSWKKTARALPWSVLTLLGGGFAMASGIQSSGLTDWVAGATSSLGALGDVPRTLLISVSVAFLSAFTSNTATTQVVLPLLAAGAAATGANPLAWMIPATIAASCDFTLAVGTPPNAIAAEAGGVRAADMAFAGIMLNFACAGIATAVVLGAGG